MRNQKELLCIYTTFHAMVKPAKFGVINLMIVNLCDKAFGKLALSLLHLFALINFLPYLFMPAYYSSNRSLYRC